MEKYRGIQARMGAFSGVIGSLESEWIISICVGRSDQSGLWNTLNRST